MDALRQRLEQGNDGVSIILRAFCLPKEFGKGFRMPSAGACFPTAVADLPQELDLGDWADATVAGAIPAAQMMGFLFANPLRSFVRYLHNAAASQSSYIAIQANSPLNDTSTSVFTCNNNAPTVLIPRWAIPNGSVFSVTPADALAAHGAFLYPATDQAGNTYLWCDGDAGLLGRIQVLFSDPSTAAGEYTVEFFRWNGRCAVPYGVAVPESIGATNVNFPVPPGGAYMFPVVHVRRNTNVASTCQWGIHTTGGIWQHRAVSNIETIAPIANGIRVNSAAVKLQNNASVNDKNGKIISATVSTFIPWTNIASGYTAVSQLQGYVDRPADNGYYGFLVPDDDDDLSNFNNDLCMESAVGIARSNTTYPLQERRPYKVIALEVPIAVGRSFIWDVCHTIEYLTNKKMVEQGKSQQSPEQAQAAVAVLRSMASDYENPLHFGKILKTIGKYLPRVSATAASVLRMIPDQRSQNAANVFDYLQPGFEDVGNNLMSFRKRKYTKG